MQWTHEDNTIMWMLFEQSKMTEAWGDPSKMHPSIMFVLEKFRAALPHGCWIKVHCGFKPNQHVKNSWHYKARAVDFHVVGCSFLEAERHLMKFLNTPVFIINRGELSLIDFMGVGIYPEWVDPGFHLDTRGKRGSWAKVNGVHVAYDVGLEEAKKRNI